MESLLVFFPFILSYILLHLSSSCDVYTSIFLWTNFFFLGSLLLISMDYFDLHVRLYCYNFACISLSVLLSLSAWCVFFRLACDCDIFLLDNITESLLLYCYIAAAILSFRIASVCVCVCFFSSIRHLFNKVVRFWLHVSPDSCTCIHKYTHLPCINRVLVF